MVLVMNAITCDKDCLLRTATCWHGMARKRARSPTRCAKSLVLRMILTVGSIRWLAILTLGSIFHPRRVGLCPHPRERLPPHVCCFSIEQPPMLVDAVMFALMGKLIYLNSKHSA